MTRALLASVALVFVAVACGGSRESKVTTFDVDGRPSAIAIGQGKVWIAEDEGHTVVAFHREGKRAYRPVKVAKNPVALAADGTDLWVAHASGRLSRIDMRTREVTVEHTDREASFTSVAVMRGRIYATDVTRGVWDVTRERWIDVPDGAVRAVAVGSALWVSGRESTVTRVLPTLGRPVEVGFGPIGLAAVEGKVWVANSDDASVQQVGQQRFVPTDRAPVALALEDGLLYVANQDGRTINVVDPGNVEDPGGASVVATIPLDTQPRGIAAGLGGVWVVGTNREVLVRVEP